MFARNLPLAIVAVCVVLAAGCTSSLTVEDLCGSFQEAGCYDGSPSDTYDSCISSNSRLFDEAAESGCESELQDATQCLIDNASQCEGGEIMATCSAELARFIACRDAA